MATIAKNARTIAATSKAKAIAKPAAPLFAGRGKEARGTALLQTAALAFATETSRAALIENVRKVLGDNPTPAQVKAAKVELVIGWVACRLPVSELPKGKTSPADRLTFAREVVTNMAAAPEDGKPVPAMGKAKARRSTVQHRITRNCEKNASLFMAELGLSNAQTQKAKNEKQAATAKATRAPAMAGSDGRANTDGQAASVWPPVDAGKPAKAMTSDDVVAYLSQQSSMLQDFANKHAKNTPTDMGMAISAFRKAVIAAANAHQERKAKAEAIAAAKAAKA